VLAATPWTVKFPNRHRSDRISVVSSVHRSLTVRTFLAFLIVVTIIPRFKGLQHFCDKSS
jgi:hypothetical protein